MSVWVEMLSEYSSASVKSRHAPRERVSWNIRIKLLKIFKVSHAPRERVSWNYFTKPCTSDESVTLHVSVWVEILRSVGSPCGRPRHAPRERVSWNFSHDNSPFHALVTLHMSLWVEIYKSYLYLFTCVVTLHVSVWVEIEYPVSLTRSLWSHAPRERVSWNENVVDMGKQILGHAPRERVSWNSFQEPLYCWQIVTLHVSVWVEIFPCNSHRIVFACHAPRERVSWNINLF